MKLFRIIKYLYGTKNIFSGGNRMERKHWLDEAKEISSGSKERRSKLIRHKRKK